MATDNPRDGLTRPAGSARTALALPGPDDGPPVIFVPVSVDDRDRFGLPMYPPSLLATPDHHAANRAAVRAVVEEVFAAARRLLGQPDATTLFDAVSAGTGGRPKGPKKPDRDRKLLRLYDQYVTQLPAGKRLNLTEFAKSQSRVDAPAILTHLRRLLRKREAETRRWHRFEAEMQRLGIGHSLLTAASAENK